MRYIGSKLRLIDFITETINMHCGDDLRGKTFCDLFAGTGIVGKSIAPLVNNVIANDLEYYSYIANKVALEGFNEEIVSNMINKLNSLKGNPDGKFAQAYSEGGKEGRLFFNANNGAKISEARDYLDSIKNELSEQDYNAVLFSIIDAADSVANTTGVYGAYLKSLKDSAKKDIVFKIPEIANKISPLNRVYQCDANKLIKDIQGDILYLDPPYNTRQYSSNYHILNYIAQNIAPETESKAGVGEHNKSKYSSKSNAASELDNLIANSNFEWIFLSYNNEGTIPFEKIKEIMSKYGEYYVEEQDYQRYKADSNRRNLLGSDKTVEYIHVLHRDKNVEPVDPTKRYRIPIFRKPKEEEPVVEVEDDTEPTGKKEIVSPLNYMGGKRKLLSQILSYFPKDINTFVDLFCGGCTVGINTPAKKVVFNDNLYQMINLFQWFSTYSPDEVVEYVESTIKKYGLNNTDVEAYNAFKRRYNEMEFKNPLDLFILIAFGFNNQVRFNGKNEFNIPFGLNRSGYNPRMKKNLIDFVCALNERNVVFRKEDFRNINFSGLTENDFVYADPPYLISQATYNSGWDETTERELLAILKDLDSRGIRFALSNVLENKGMENTILKQWIEENGFRVIHFNLSYANSAYCRKEKDTKTDEVLILNY